MKILVMLLSLIIAGGSVSEVSMQRFMTAVTTTETAVAVVEPAAPPIGYQSQKAAVPVAEPALEAVAEAWVGALSAGWTEPAQLYYMLVDEDVWASYPTLAIAELGDMIALELYYARNADEFWLIVEQLEGGAEDDAMFGRALVRSVQAFDAALLDEAGTALLLDALQESMDTLRTEESEGDYPSRSFYNGDLYVSVNYDVLTGLFNSFVALP